MRKCILFILCASIVSFGQVPVLGSISITTGSQGENLMLTCFGTDFVSTPTVDFGTGISTTGIIFITSSIMNVDISISPTAPLGPHDVIVTNPMGEADTLFDGFQVLPETDPPIVNVVFPPTCGMFSSCIDTMIIIELFDENGIDDATLQLDVDGTIYTISDPEVILVGDTLVYFIPFTWFDDGDTVNFSVIQVADSFGNIATMPLICSFTVDTMPPELTEPVPPMGASCRDLTPTILFPISDAGAGVDSSSFVVTIITPEGDTLLFPWGSSTLRWDRDTLSWEASIAGLSFAEDETIWICISAEDLIDADGCGPNYMDTCWHIYFHVPPPMDMDLILDRIYTDQFPLVSGFCLLLDEYDNTIEGLDESNFTVWEDHGGGWTEQNPIIAYLRGGGGMADIVFCVDITGSMYGMIDDVVTGLSDFAESLAVAGISYRLGLNTFGDTVYFPFGYDLTGDIGIFTGWVSSLTSGGGGDGPEVSLDAINDALDLMSFRPGATIVIIMVTDAPPHEIGDGTVYSDVTCDIVLTNLLANRALCFIVADTFGWTWYSPPYEGEDFYPLTEGTGGAFFSWSGAGDFDLILPLIAEAVRGGYMVSWSSSNPLPDCTIRDARIRAEEFGLSDEDEDEYLAPCSPIAAIVEPLPQKWTSDTFQTIIMTFAEIEDSINPNSIMFMVDGTVYNPLTSPLLTYADPLLRWNHVIPFYNGQRVDAELVRVMDSQGNLPFSGPIHWYFRVDLAPPKLGNRNPDDGDIILEHQPRICFDIWDDESGLSWDGLLVSIDCHESRTQWPPLLVTLDQSSPGVSIAGNCFCWNPAVEGYSFPDNDTVCVTILRAFDSPDYGEPNELPDSLQRWCFRIPDDDTLCPEFFDLTPDSDTLLPANIPFTITARIMDPSGVWYAWVEWDDDGSLDDGTFQITDMVPLFGDTFGADIEGQSEFADFVYQICACDADTDNGDSSDTECCCSEEMILYIGFGPEAEIIEPFPATVSTNEDQRIVMRIYDDDGGVDPTTVELFVDGTIYYYGADFNFIADTMFFVPPVSGYFSDGDSVEVELLAADDNAGNHLRGSYNWKFFIDLTPPFVENSDPVEGQIIEDRSYDMVFNLDDVWRLVDSSSILIEASEREFRFGDDGMYWDFETQTIRLKPENADPAVTFPNGETTCVVITCSDSPPDYGEPNQMEQYEICFIFSITTCDARPQILTPNGDGINDIVYFQYPKMIFGDGIINIFDLEGEGIWESEHGAVIWDCRSSTGSIVLSGLYLYTVTVEGEVVCSGSLTVIR